MAVLFVLDLMDLMEEGQLAVADEGEGSNVGLGRREGDFSGDTKCSVASVEVVENAMCGRLGIDTLAAGRSLWRWL